MTPTEIEALSKWEIKDLDAKQAIDWLVKVNIISGHTALFGLAYFIHCMTKKEADLQQRLRELDERNQTQAHCLAVRDAEVRRLNRMVDLSCKILGDVPGICLDKSGMRKFLESEVAE